jgi:hypothetical protein
VLCHQKNETVKGQSHQKHLNFPQQKEGMRFIALISKRVNQAVVFSIQVVKSKTHGVIARRATIFYRVKLIGSKAAWGNGIRIDEAPYKSPIIF